MLARRDGSIVNIASIGGKVAFPHLLPYVASKFAMTGWSQGLRAELAEKGIRVTTVAPGIMRTGSHIQARYTGNGKWLASSPCRHQLLRVRQGVARFASCSHRAGGDGDD
jgi:short-subunit dehydrogenase